MNEIVLMEDYFIFSHAKDLDKLFNMNMSKDFMSLFGIQEGYKQIHDFPNNRVKFKLPVTKMPKVQSDISPVFYTPYAVNKQCSFSVNQQEIFRLTPQYWTINMFKRAINAIGKKLPKGSWLASLAVEDGANSNEDFVLVMTANRNLQTVGSLTKTHVEVEFNKGFIQTFQVTKSMS